MSPPNYSLKASSFGLHHLNWQLAVITFYVLVGLQSAQLARKVPRNKKFEIEGACAPSISSIHPSTTTRHFWVGWCRKSGHELRDKIAILSKKESEMTSKQRRQYAEEFKRETVELIQNSGKSQAQISRELGISNNNLSRWLQKYGQGND